MSRHAKESLCPPSLVSATARLSKELAPTAIIAEYIFTAPCLDGVNDSTLKLIDTIDMFSRKKEQVIKYGIQDSFACSSNEERGLLLKGDVIVAIQKIEEQMFRSLVPERRVITVGIDFSAIKRSSEGVLDKDTVLVVGSDNPLNIHGLNAFCEHAWPKIVNSCPDIILKVVGKVGAHLNICDKNIVKAGLVHDLDEEYAKATVVINPVLAGTGLKIKSVEALCRGKALVTTKNGAEGISAEAPLPFVICDEWDSFAIAVIALLQSKDERTSIELRAWKYALTEFSSERIYDPLKKVLDEQIRNSKVHTG